MTVIIPIAAVAPAATLAGPLDEFNTWLDQWGTALQAVGVTILGICAVVVGIQICTKALASDNAQAGTRQSISKLFVIALGGIVIGAALVLVPMVVNIGKKSGTTTAPADPPAATAPA